MSNTHVHIYNNEPGHTARDMRRKLASILSRIPPDQEIRFTLDYVLLDKPEVKDEQNR